MLSHFSPCLTLCDPIDGMGSPHTVSSVHGILQARMLEWVPFPSPGDLPNPGIEPRSPALQADTLTPELPGKRIKPFVHLELTLCGDGTVTKLCLTLISHGL